MSAPGQFTCEELLGPLNEVEAKYAPKCIYAQGDRDILSNGFRVSIVGSRKASMDGLRRARKLAQLVCSHGGVVVSGLAAGIDAAAHKGAITAGGRTVAVIGTALDKFYPRENADLQRLIMAEHLCISQFPIGYPITPGNFPMRNRTMALFSDATAIVEAGEKSGSISQGWEALRLGRSLFISKWLVEEAGLEWPRKMMEYGAQVLTDDSVEELFLALPERDATLELDVFAF